MTVSEIVSQQVVIHDVTQTRLLSPWISKLCVVVVDSLSPKKKSERSLPLQETTYLSIQWTKYQRVESHRAWKPGAETRETVLRGWKAAEGTWQRPRLKGYRLVALAFLIKGEQPRLQRGGNVFGHPRNSSPVTFLPSSAINNPRDWSRLRRVSVCAEPKQRETERREESWERRGRVKRPLVSLYHRSPASGWGDVIGL